MATTTTNFGWDIPQSTDLVKDGATAIAALGQDIDTALVDLKGGTTGQILSKASNTDLDYTWINANPGDITAVTAGTGISGGGTSGDVTITNSMATAIDAKGDLIAGTGADAFSRLAVGTDGQVLTADSTAATGIKWATASGSSGPTFLAYNNANQTVTAGAWTKLNLNSEVFDTDGAFASSRFTPNKAGYYVLETTVTSNGTCYGVLYKNGSAYKYLANSSADIYASGGIVVYANGSTDYFEIYVKSSGATVYGGSSLECTFSGAWIRS